MLKLAWKIAGIDVPVCTHDAPHVDEIVALWLMRKYGRRSFLEKYWPNLRRSIEIGTGHGPFNEHPGGQFDKRPKGVCAATLVAEALGVERLPSLKKILMGVAYADQHASSGMLELGNLVKRAHVAFPNDPKLVIEAACLFIEGLYHDQVLFQRALDDVRDSWARLVTGSNGDPITVLIGKSDNPCFDRAGRCADGAGAVIVIHETSKGNIRVIPKRKLGLPMDDIVAHLRLREQQLCGSVVETDMTRLRAEGFAHGWHFEFGSIQNGTLTSMVPPTCVPRSVVTDIVVTCVSGLFYDRYSDKCRKGICQGDVCPWFERDLRRCRHIRAAADMRIANA